MQQGDVDFPAERTDQCAGLTRANAYALDDPRDPDLTEYTFRKMARCCVHGIPAGYQDQNHHDTLRADPVFKLVADRSPEDDDLASQPTLSRFGNAISIKSLKRMSDVFLDQFFASFDAPPRHLTYDLHALDDPANARQKLTFWHETVPSQVFVSCNPCARRSARPKSPSQNP